MEKTRTIAIDNRGKAYYRNKELGYLQIYIRKEFGIPVLDSAGKYKTTIKECEGGLYQFKASGDSDFYELYECSSDNYIGHICRVELHKLFFEPDSRKNYDITVKKVG